MVISELRYMLDHNILFKWFYISDSMGEEGPAVIKEERIVYRGIFDGRSYYVLLQGDEKILRISPYIVRGEIQISRVIGSVGCCGLLEIKELSSSEVLERIAQKSLPNPLIAFYGEGFRTSKEIRSFGLWGNQPYPLANALGRVVNKIYVSSIQDTGLEQELAKTGLRIGLA